MKIEFKKNIKTLLSYSFLILSVLAVKSSLAANYYVPTGSMQPTIEPGDRLFVNKMAYDLKVPFTHTTLVTLDHPKRGDVVVFDHPKNSSMVLVKRLIGIPGDVLSIKNGYIAINGTVLPVTEPTSSPNHVAFQYSETLNGKSYTINRLPHLMRKDIQTVTIPKDHYFFMGDNRDNSADSRSWGFAHRSLIKGQAKGIIFSTGSSKHGLPTLRLNRSGKAL